MAQIRPDIQTEGLLPPAESDGSTTTPPTGSTTTTTVAPTVTVPPLPLTPEDQALVDALKNAATGVEEDFTVRAAPTNLTPPFRLESARGLNDPYTNRRVLIDERGVALKDASGQPKVQYVSDDVEGEWFNLGYETRKAYANAFYALGLYGETSKPSTTLTDEKDLRVFANLLTASNIEFRSWRATLDLISKRYIPVPRKGGVSLVDIKRQLDTSAQSIVGRKLRPKEEKTAVAGVGARGSATVAGASEEQLNKQLGPEATAYRFAQYAQALNQMLGQ